MKKTVVLLAFALLAQPCFAEGWATLGGSNASGHRVEVYPAFEGGEASRDYSIESNREFFYVTIYFSADGAMQETYKDLRCKFEHKKQSERPSVFSCESKPGYPLSGAIYRIVSNPDRADCGYKDRYVCVSGCDNPLTPQEMKSSYYECEP